MGSFFTLRSGNIRSEDTHSWLLDESNTYCNSYNKTKKIELPPLIIAESDFNIFMYPNSQPNYIGSGRVSGEVVTLESENSSVVLEVPVSNDGHLGSPSPENFY